MMTMWRKGIAEIGIGIGIGIVVVLIVGFLRWEVMGFGVY